MGDAPWFKNDADEIMWSDKQVDEIVDENSTRWKNIGETFTTTDNNGNVMEGDAAGNVSVVLPEIAIDGGKTGLEKADIIVTATSPVVDITEGLVKAAGSMSEAMAKDAGYLNIVKSLKGLGTGLGIASVVISGIEAYQEPTLGNTLKLGWDLGIAFSGPVGGLLDTVFSASGYKKKLFKYIYATYENHKNSLKQEQEQDNP